MKDYIIRVFFVCVYYICLMRRQYSLSKIEQIVIIWIDIKVQLKN
jgi:hypothetical protein